MRWRPSRGSCLLLASLALMVGLLYADRGKEPPADPIAALVEQLGHRRFDKREEAVKRLEALGEKALPALQRAANSKDLEIRRRVREVIRAILTTACKTQKVTLPLVAIEAGEFRMGSPLTEPGRRADEAQHRVRITQPFVLGTHEVTQEAYQQVMKRNPSWFTTKGTGKDRVTGQRTEQFPVESVSWFDATEFCNQLSKLEGLPEYYTITDVKKEGDSISSARVTIAGGNGFRLPTEAEWEYACRAETATVYHFGNDTRSGVLNCKPLLIASGYGSALKWADLSRSATVGSYKPNAWGLHDMHGNVAEWCWDWYDRDYYSRSPVDDPKGPQTGTHRVRRGGSWLVSEGSCRSASRSFGPPDERAYTAGFRVARTPSP